MLSGNNQVWPQPYLASIRHIAFALGRESVQFGFLLVYLNLSSPYGRQLFMNCLVGVDFYDLYFFRKVNI